MYHRTENGEAEILTKEIDMKYGMANLRGHTAIDKICLREQSACIDDFYFFSVSVDT